MVRDTQEERDSSVAISRGATETSAEAKGGRINPTTGAAHRVTDFIEAIEQGLTNQFDEAIEQGLTNQVDDIQHEEADPPGELAQGVLFPSTGTTDPTMGTVHPSTGTTCPSPSTVNPSTGNTDPSTGIMDRSAGKTNPSTGTADNSARTIDPSTGTTNGNIVPIAVSEQEVAGSFIDNIQGIAEPSIREAQAVASKVALVTGAARGMGRSFANQLLSMGYKVCIVDIVEDQGLHTCKQLAEQHGHDNVTFIKCDVTKDEDFENAWTVCLGNFGPVTLLVNNAGIGNETNWTLTLNVNLGGCIRGTNLAMEKMALSKGGQGGIVINIASVAGLKPHCLGPVYSATKHAIVGFTRSMGDDFYYNKTNVKVMCLCPSLVETEFLSDSAQNASSRDVQKMLQHIDANAPKLGLEEIDKGLIKLIQDGKNGSVLVIEKEKEMKYVDSKL